MPNRNSSFPKWELNGIDPNTNKPKLPKKVDYFTASVKPGPGVGQKSMNYEAYTKLSKSPSLKKMRH